MKHLSRTTAVTVLCLMLTVILMACTTPAGDPDVTTANPTTAATTKATVEPTATPEPMTIDNITVVMRSYNQVQWDGSAFDQLVQDNFGLKMDVQVIDMSSYAEKFKVMFNTNNLPDVCTVFGIQISELNEAGDRGLFLDYYDYIDIMPTLKSILTENKSLMPYITAASGSLYYAPLYYGTGDHLNGKGIGVRKDLLDNAGFDYSNLQSMDELYAMFAALKEQNPDKYVIGSRYQMGNVYLLGNLMGISEDAGTWNVEQQQWIPTYEQPGMKDFVTFWANAYADGILHPDFLTMQASDMWQMYYNGELTAFIDAISYTDAAVMNAYSDEVEWDYVMPPLYNGQRYGIPSNAGFGWINTKIVSSATKVPEKIMKFIDWTYTDEGFLRSWFGEDGTDYVLLNTDPLQWIVLDETYKDFLPSEYQDRLLNAEQIAARKAEAPYYLYGFYSKNTLWGTFAKYNKPNTETIYQRAYADYDAKGVYGPANPTIALEGEELEEFNNLNTTIEDYSSQMVAQMITGQVDIEAEWDNFIATIDAYGYDRLMELYAISTDNFFSVTPKFNP